MSVVRALCAIVATSTLLLQGILLLNMSSLSTNPSRYVDIYRTYWSGSMDTDVDRTEELAGNPHIPNFDGRKEPLSRKAMTQDRCSYKVQVYDQDDRLAKKSRALQNIVRMSRGRPVIKADVTCSNDCNMEITIADNKKNFTGMDAVVFHFSKTLIPPVIPPAGVNPKQAWVFFSWESPLSNEIEGGDGTLSVHATWTYSRSSDITTPYGFYRPGIPMTRQAKSVEQLLDGKTRLLAWMASNCRGTFWPRTGFVRLLKRYIPVDVYGACGNLSCTPTFSRKCTVDLLRRYKFYLALENAECEDYITEKLWHKPLMQGVVPIVYGPRRQVYEDLLPPNSFIYVGDYKNIQELAEHLKLLDSQPELYVRYLEWQYHGSVGITKRMRESYDPSIFCNLIPVIEKVKRGHLEMIPVDHKKSKFAKSCRLDNDGLNTTSGFSIGKGSWNPW